MRTCLSLCLLAAAASAQPAAFEAATVKPNPSGDEGSSWNTRPGYLVMKNQSLRRLVAIAYGMTPERVAGGPKWADDARFDVEARAAGPAKDPELLAMLQTLLADRFQFAFHREARPAAAYALVIAKGGLRIQPDATAEKGSSSNNSRGKIAVQRVTMPKLADSLTRVLGVPVVDQTEAKGVYTFTIEWTPEPPRSAAPDRAIPEASTGPSVFDVLPEKLGLKLESRKLPVDVIVIDRAERPGEN
jgi:uncharacterized protein (TIGR03435 family)